jgi:hypothetical protein
MPEQDTLENERSELIKRQMELEKAMKRLGGARVTEEQELHVVRDKLRLLSEATQSADDAAPAGRRSPK